MKTFSVMAFLGILAVVIVALGAACQKSESKGEASKQQYTCPMHPEVLQNGPGKCPKCAMALELKK